MSKKKEFRLHELDQYRRFSGGLLQKKPMKQRHVEQKLPSKKRRARSHTTSSYRDKDHFGMSYGSYAGFNPSFFLTLFLLVISLPQALAQARAKDKEVQAIDYLAGVMDEETRPLLKSYIDSLVDGESALVIYRLAKGANRDILFESSIQEISGHDWNFVSYGKRVGSFMQALVDNLAETAMSLRVANAMFSQGGAKIKATDTHEIAFGLVGKKGESEIPTSVIKGIVHQQLNMGYNGDLLLHEWEVILKSLLAHGVLNDAQNKTRPLKFKTYGAGGSTSDDTHPGDMRESDGVIDFRSHVDPLCIIEYFDSYIAHISVEDRKKLDSTLLQDYKKQVALIKEKMDYNQVIQSNGELIDMFEIGAQAYTGSEMIPDIAELGRKIAAYTAVPITKIMDGMNKENKRYYGEITFATVNTGISMIYRIQVNESGMPFLGDRGQHILMRNLQDFLERMSLMNEQLSESHDKEFESLYAIADRELRRRIEQAKDVYAMIFPGHEFSITASGNLFFSGKEKESLSRYGSKIAEMENQLFLQIVHYSIIVNKIFIAEAYITKIATDPLKITPEVSDQLNRWAEHYSMTIDDYVAAFMWANQGQSFMDFPDNGRWAIAERLYKENVRNKLMFYNFGTEEEPRIINPFWKEIGTDLVKEIFEGKAFEGNAFRSMDFNSFPLDKMKRDLQILAEEVMTNKEDVALNVRKLFTEYLQLMMPMHISRRDGTYKVYARKIPVLKAGYVEGGVSDWDQLIYKSTNTVVLAKKSAAFIAAASQGKAIGGGKALIVAKAQVFTQEGEYSPCFFTRRARLRKSIRENLDLQDIDACVKSAHGATSS